MGKAFYFPVGLNPIKLSYVKTYVYKYGISFVFKTNNLD